MNINETLPSEVILNSIIMYTPLQLWFNAAFCFISTEVASPTWLKDAREYPLVVFFLGAFTILISY
jgi:hypothetical protein